MALLKDCPICGKKAYISRDEPDGFFMGWSVGCPAYKKNDGVHEVNAAFHNITTKQRAIEKWNKYCEVI